MMEGWIKIHRVLFDHPIWKNSSPEQKVILITLIGMVNHEPNKWEWGGEIFDIDRGQVVTSLDSIKKMCGKGISTQNVRTALARFEKLNFLTSKSTKRGRLITIENYSKWQDDVSENNKEANKDLTKTQQRPNKDLTSNKNDKNDKNDKKYIYSDVPEEIKKPFMQWAEMREKIKKPITSKETVTRALNRLDKLADSTEKKIEIINLATDRCWRSFYPPSPETKTESKKYKMFQQEDYERDDYKGDGMPQELRDKLSGMFGKDQK